jgi:hypothetical protein
VWQPYEVDLIEFLTVSAYFTHYFYQASSSSPPRVDLKIYIPTGPKFIKNWVLSR